MNNVPIPNNITVTEVPESVGKNKRIEWLSYKLKNFCVLPWLNLNTNPNGFIKLCCNIQLDHFVQNVDEPFNLGYDDIDTLWNSPYMDNVRYRHRTNLGAEDCVECYKSDRTLGHSPRMGQNVLWFEKKDGDSDLSNFLNKITYKDPFTQLDQLPLSLELRLGNQCNLQCISCWGMSSSLVQSERLDILDKGLLKEYNLEKIDKKWKEETDIVINSKLTEWYETDMFYENFRKMAPKLKRLYTTGGEPTVIKANYKILEMLLEAGNKSCSVEFTSNMTTWNNKFYDALAQFENVEIQMSIDGVDEIGEYIRYPSNFKIVRENMFKAVEMASDNPNWKIKCYTVLQALNYKHLVPIWELLTEVAATYQKKIDWWPITLSSPEHLSLSSVPMQERLDYIPEIIEQSMRFRDPSKAFSVSSSTVGAITDSLTNMTYNYELNNTFNNYVRFLNDYRKKNDS